MGLFKFLILTTLILKVSCGENVTVGDLPEEIQNEIIDILLGGLVFTGQCPPPSVSEIEFLLYTPNDPDNPISLNVSNPMEIAPSKPVIILIHGWMSGANVIFMPELRNAYLQRYGSDCNLIVLDWSTIAAELYTTSYCEVPAIADVAAEFLCLLQEQYNIDMASVHLVGHSLGAQMSGYIGQDTVDKCGKQVGRITGLDPAGPLYQGLPPSKRLDSNDAIFVDVIHTNELEFGYFGPSGDVDFYVSCGLQQPGCIDFNIADIKNTLILVVGCSHIRSIPLMIESVNSNKFKAKSCTSCPAICKSDLFPSQIIMGEDCPTNPAKSSYWIKTNGSPPYARG